MQLDYFIIAVLSILILVMALLHLYENDIFSVETIKKFRRLIYFIMFEVCIDTVFEYLSCSNNTHKLLLYILKAIELSGNTVMPILVLEIFVSKRKRKINDVEKKPEKPKKIEKIRKILLVISWLNIFLMIISMYANFVFYIDENNLYQRGNFLILYVFMLGTSIFLLLYGIVLFSTNTQYIMKGTLFCFFFILGVGMIIRSIFSRTNFDWLCVSIAVLVLLVYYSNITLRIDPLTKLLNRRVYSRLLERINYNTLIIMIDANYLKLTNDTYGHKSGDKTLQLISKLISKAYGKYAYCFRLGGDEFCAILKKGVFDELLEETPNCDAYAMAENFTKILNQLIEKTKTEDKNDYLKYGISQGFAIYYDSTNDPEAPKMSVKEVIELADKMMYVSKQEFKQSISEKVVEQTTISTRGKVLYSIRYPELIESSVQE